MGFLIGPAIEINLIGELDSTNRYAVALADGTVDVKMAKHRTK